MSKRKHTKSKAILVRVSPAERDQLKQAAIEVGSKYHTLMRVAAICEATKILRGEFYAEQKRAESYS